MGRSRFKFHETHYSYFITCSVVDGIPLFSDPELASIVLTSLSFIHTEWAVKLYGYVIMENHCHMVLKSEHPSEHIRNFKSYTAKKMIHSLQKRGRTLILEKLRFHKKLHKHQSIHQVWQEGVHAKQIDSDKKMNKVLEYIHFNPVKAGYIEDPVQWRYSSARNYFGRAGLIPVSLFDA